MTDQNTIADLSTTPASNLNFKGQNIRGTALANTIDTMFQNEASMLKAFYDSLGGVATVSGTDTYTVTITEDWAAYGSGLWLAIKPANANTGAATLNVTVPTAGALGAKAIRRQGDSALQANDMLANGVYLLRYSSTYNSSAGAWVLLNPAVPTTSTNLDTLWAKGSNVASATTTALGSGNFFHITGTTTITDIDFTSALDGRMAWVEFDGALTLTHNGTTLTLPGARNITTAAGDRCLLVQDNSDNVHVLFYQPYISDPPYITPLVAYTPTFTGFGTVSNVSFFSRRVGDHLHVRGKVTAGTTTATEGRITLGFNGTDNNVTIDSTKNASIRIVGTWGSSGTAVGSAAPALLAEASVGYMTFGLTNGSNAALTKQNGNTICGTGAAFVVDGMFPITGW